MTRKTKNLRDEKMNLIAGLPPHTAMATNKMSSTCGTALATLRFIKNKLVNFKLEHFQMI